MWGAPWISMTHGLQDPESMVERDVGYVGCAHELGDYIYLAIHRQAFMV